MLVYLWSFVPFVSRLWQLDYVILCEGTRQKITHTDWRYNLRRYVAWSLINTIHNVTVNDLALEPDTWTGEYLLLIYIYRITLIDKLNTVWIDNCYIEPQARIVIVKVKFTLFKIDTL